MEVAASGTPIVPSAAGFLCKEKATERLVSASMKIIDVSAAVSLCNQGRVCGWLKVQRIGLHISHTTVSFRRQKDLGGRVVQGRLLHP